MAAYDISTETINGIEVTIKYYLEGRNGSVDLEWEEDLSDEEENLLYLAADKICLEIYGIDTNGKSLKMIELESKIKELENKYKN
jgi:hypothetical protein